VSAATAAYAPVARRFRRSVVSSVASLLASVLTVLVVSRRVDPREYGRVAVILAVWGLLFNSIDWCGGVVMRFGPVELARSATLRVTVATRLVFALPPLLLLAVAAPLYLCFGRDASPHLVALTAAWIVASTAYNVLSWSAIAAQRFGPLTVAGVVMKASPLLPVAVAIVRGRSVIAEEIVGAMLFGTIVAALILHRPLRPLLGSARPDRKLLSAMWRYAVPSLIGVPSLAAITWLDPLLLDRYGTRADVGRYQLAYPVFTVFAMLGASLNSVLSPELVRAGAEHGSLALGRYRDRMQPRFGLYAGLACFGGALFAAPTMRALLPDGYAASADLVALLSVAGGYLIAFWTLLPMVTATDRVWSLQTAYFIQAFVNVALDAILVQRYGSTGIALANIAAWSAAFVTLTLLLSRGIGAHRSTLLPLLCAGGFVTLLLLVDLPEASRAVLGIALVAGSGAMGWRAYRRLR
jgi:O-antigen/teichoic acid export membrane protein